MGEKRRIVIYHGPHCPDGFMGAWVANKVYGDHVVYYPTTYGEPPPDLAEYDEVIIIDFSYSPKILHEMCKQVEVVTLLDHHETAKKAIDEYETPDPLFPENFISRIKFDVSGAVVAWQYYTNELGCKGMGSDMPTLIKYVSDRDLHNYYLPHSREISAYIMSIEKTFVRWDMLVDELENNFDDVVKKGEIVLGTRNALINEIVGNSAHHLLLDQTTFCAVNTSTLYSEAIDVLIAGKASDDKIALAWYITADYVKFSVRSTDGCFMTAQELAEMYGGGGHVHAAGFRMSYSNFKKLVKVVY